MLTNSVTRLVPKEDKMKYSGQVTLKRRMPILEELVRMKSKTKVNAATVEVAHPGAILSEDFLIPAGISRYRLAKETFMDITRISEIIRGDRGITADTALRLAHFFGNSPEFWLNLQNQYDLDLKRQELAAELEKIRRHE